MTNQIESEKLSVKLSENEIEKLVSGSFLRYIPELLESGLPMEQAVKTAFERDLTLVVELQMVAERRSSGGWRACSDKDEAHAGLIEMMSRRIWLKFNENKMKTPLPKCANISRLSESHFNP